MDYKENVITLLNSQELSEEQKEKLEAIFPELKESEDEKIRKELICFLETEIPQCTARDKYVAWLEKQSKESSSKVNEDFGKYTNELSEQFPEVSFAKLSRMAVRIKNWLEKQGEQKPTPALNIEIPFGAKDSELQEVSYHIPEGFHAEIQGNKVVIKHGRN